MADNLVVRTQSGNDIVAADDISGVKFTRVKFVLGADGSNNGDVSSSNPVPTHLHDYTFGEEQTGSVDTSTAVPLFDGESGRPERSANSRRIRICNCSSSGAILVRYGTAPTSSVFAEYIYALETRDLDVKVGVTPYILASGSTVNYLAQDLS